MNTCISRWVGACALSLLAWQTASAQVGKSVTIVDANIATDAQLSAIPQLTPAQRTRPPVASVLPRTEHRPGACCPQKQTPGGYAAAGDEGKP